MMKYVNMEQFGYVIFEKHIKHEDIVNRLRGDMEIEVKSAGFVSSLEDSPLDAFGESQTLGKKAIKGDTTSLNAKIEQFHID